MNIVIAEFLQRELRSKLPDSLLLAAITETGHEIRGKRDP